MRLAVHIHDSLAGHVIVTGHHDAIEFRPADSYAHAYPRPVLGQVFEDEPEAVHRSRVRLPPFFSNLLPEGLLRGLLAKSMGITAQREPWLLAQLGDDLPGAVRVAAEEGDEELPVSAGDESPADHDGPLKFSLAGVQLKFSALRHDRGLTIPAHGVGGDWIVKLPDARHQNVPANEWSMMTWAREAQIDTPDIDLAKITDIVGLPADVGDWNEEHALIVKRFDRSHGKRIHIEDFAQVLNVYAESKYKKVNLETIGKIIFTVAGANSFREYVRRLIFNLAIGNGDAHLKNWSLIYRDDVHATLSPAYDLVSTIQYIANDELALNLARERRFSAITRKTLQLFAERVGVSTDLVMDEVDRSTSDIRAAWLNLRGSLPLDREQVDRLEGHWQSIPLLADGTTS